MEKTVIFHGAKVPAYMLIDEADAAIIRLLLESRAKHWYTVWHDEDASEEAKHYARLAWRQDGADLQRYGVNDLSV